MLAPSTNLISMPTPSYKQLSTNFSTLSRKNHPQTHSGTCTTTRNTHLQLRLTIMIQIPSVKTCLMVTFYDFPTFNLDWHLKTMYLGMFRLYIIGSLGRKALHLWCLRIERELGMRITIINVLLNYDFYANDLITDVLVPQNFLPVLIQCHLKFRSTNPRLPYPCSTPTPNKALNPSTTYPYNPPLISTNPTPIQLPPQNPTNQTSPSS